MSICPWLTTARKIFATKPDRRVFQTPLIQVATRFCWCESADALRRRSCRTNRDNKKAGPSGKGNTVTSREDKLASRRDSDSETETTDNGRWEKRFQSELPEVKGQLSRVLRVVGRSLHFPAP